MAGFRFGRVGPPKRRRAKVCLGPAVARYHQLGSGTRLQAENSFAPGPPSQPQGPEDPRLTNPAVGSMFVRSRFG